MAQSKLQVVELRVLRRPGSDEFRLQEVRREELRVGTFDKVDRFVDGQAGLFFGDIYSDLQTAEAID